MAILMEEQNSRRCATVRAVTSCDMLTVNGDTLRKVLAEHPAVLEDLLEGAMSRAEQTRALWAAHVAWKRAKRAVKARGRREREGEMEMWGGLCAHTMPALPALLCVHWGCGTDPVLRADAPPRHCAQPRAQRDQLHQTPHHDCVDAAPGAAAEAEVRSPLPVGHGDCAA